MRRKSNTFYMNLKNIRTRGVQDHTKLLLNSTVRKKRIKKLNVLTLLKFGLKRSKKQENK